MGILVNFLINWILNIFATKICDKITKGGRNYFNFPFFILKLTYIWHVVHENLILVILIEINFFEN